MIYIDHTEGRENTKLSPEILRIAKSIIGLEAQTGADLLITSCDEKLPPNVNIPPAKPILKRCCESGMLVQRKTGGDMLGSIPHLSEILQRMQQWNTVCWLMVCGEFKPSSDNLVVVNGRPTDWAWASFRGAVDAWQLRGGLVAEHPDDYYGGVWLNRWDANIHKLGRDHIIHKPVEKIIGGMFDPYPWRQVLMGFPDCGPELSMRIAEYCGSLAHSIWWMTDTGSTGNIPGVGAKRKEAWRHWLGLADDEVMMPLKADEKYHVTEVPQPKKLVEQQLLGINVGAIHTKELVY